MVVPIPLCVASFCIGLPHQTTSCGGVHGSIANVCYMGHGCTRAGVCSASGVITDSLCLYVLLFYFIFLHGYLPRVNLLALLFCVSLLLSMLFHMVHYVQSEQRPVCLHQPAMLSKCFCTGSGMFFLTISLNKFCVAVLAFHRLPVSSFLLHWNVCKNFCRHSSSFSPSPPA